MLKKIVHTFLTKFLTAFIQFGVIVALSKYLGAGGKGEASLFLASLSNVLLISELVGGPAVVYHASRFAKKIILVPSYVWLLLISLVFAFPLIAFSSLPNSLWWQLLLLSVCQGISAIHQYYLLGNEEIKKYNYLQLVRVISLGVGLFVAFYFTEKHALQDYINALHFSQFLPLALSSYWVFKFKSKAQNIDFKSGLKALISDGFWVQTVNIIQFLNYRLSFFLIDGYISTAQVGVYSNAVHFVEVIWIVSRSLSVVQYSFIANEPDGDKNILLTQKMITYTLPIAILGLVFFIFLPPQFYVWLLGDNLFAAIPNLLIYLALGTVAIALHGIVGHYFSGNSWFKLNLIPSLVGLVFTLVFCFWLIPIYGIVGAAIATSLSYCATFAVSWIIWHKKTKVGLFRWHEIGKDFRTLKSKYF